ncbi:FERM domain-containing protein 8 isoform X2 [Canis lupus baileyi]|uniref:FERM domain-containing protein 8 isoform X2 n=1 Tax=Canis lupus familiaris TaxID=9615 RepID=UPI0018F3A0F9|nr:FERM domain-containing protein 8 isoform X2 [Canis lupus familiaris]XP_038419880.1 FERM domain-containing protein 8 isoform X2 [Canis lupus familiaris]
MNGRDRRQCWATGPRRAVPSKQRVLRGSPSHTLRDGCSPCFKMRQLTFTPAEEVRVLAGAQARIGTQVYWPPGSVLPYGSCSSRDGDLNLATLPRVFLQHQTPDKIIRAITTADVLVYLADDTVVPLAVENLPSLSAHELHRAVREVLQLPDIALDAFALWLVSPLLEVQLKPKHQPYKLGRQWPELLLRFTDAPDDDVAMDEPSLQFRRNVFFPKRRELQIHDEEVLRLLYEEAKGNVLAARYPCDVEDCETLGALVCRVQLGPYQPGQPTACALREKLDSFLPAHLCKRGHGLFAALRGRGAKAGTGEQGLLNAYCKVKEAGDGEHGASLSTHYRAYLLKSHELPFYGCAFFHGEVDKPAQGFLHRGGRKQVAVAISLEGVHVIDSREKHVLLGLRFQELSWDHTSPEEEESVLWLEFDGDNEGTPVNKLLKIYSKQAELMSSLIEYCIELNQTSEPAASQENVSGTPSAAGAPPPPIQRPQLRRQGSVVCSRLQHLSTIDYVEEGQQIKRVKPKRTTSFFSRQLSMGQGSYTVVQPTDSLEQG